MRTTGLVYEDLERFPDDNLRREIIGGELFASPSPETPHQRAGLRLALALHQYAERLGGEVFIAPLDVVLNAQNVVEPDIFYVAAERHDVVGRKGLHGAPSLVVEILSPSTARIDRVKKRELYARFGIPEYWIVDTENRTVERCSDPQGSAYQTTVTFDTGNIVAATLPGFELSLDAAFG